MVFGVIWVKFYVVVFESVCQFLVVCSGLQSYRYRVFDGFKSKFCRVLFAKCGYGICRCVVYYDWRRSNLGVIFWGWLGLAAGGLWVAVV